MIAEAADVTDQEVQPRPASGPATSKVVVIMLLVGLFAYFNSLHGAYILDDARYLADPNIDSPLRAEMATRPLFMASLTLNHRLDGFHHRGYHLFNLSVHLLAAFTLFDLLRRTLVLPRFAGRFDTSSGWIALVISMLWLSHPLNTQAVTYMVQRCESMMGLFFLLAMWCFLRGATGTRKFWWYSAMMMSCLAAAGCKEVIAMFPPLALLYDRMFISGSWRAALRARGGLLAAACIPCFAPVLALAIIGFFTDKVGTVGFGVKLFTPYTYALTQTEVILYYIQLSFYPKGLCLDYIDWPVRHSLAECWPSALMLLTLLGIMGYGVVKNRAWAFPMAWFFVILAPTSSFLPIQDAVFEHRMYLPLIGIITLVTLGVVAALRFVVDRVPASRGMLYRTAGVSAVCLITLLAFRTVVRNSDYGSATKMYADNVEKRPANPRARHNLAMALFTSGDIAGANHHIDVLATVPLQIPSLRVDQIRVLRENGRTAEALALAQRLYSDDPNLEGATYELGVSLLTEDRPAEAVVYLEKAVASFPDNRTGRTHLGIALIAAGREGDGMRELRIAQGLDPTYAKQLLQVARRTALKPDAKPSALKLVTLYADAACRMIENPNADARDTYGICLARIGRFSEAAVQADQAEALARQGGDSYHADRIHYRAELYRAGKAYPHE